MNRLSKKIKITAGLSVLTFLSLGLFYIFVDFVSEWWLTRLADQKGHVIKNLNIEHLNGENITSNDFSMDLMLMDALNISLSIAEISKPQFWHYFRPDEALEMKELEASTKFGKVGARKVESLYEWNFLKPKLRVLNLDHFTIFVNGNKLDEFRKSIDDNSSEAKNNQVQEEDLVQNNSGGQHAFINFLEDPELTFMRVRESSIDAEWNNLSYGFDYNATAKLVENFINIQLDANSFGMPVKGALSFSKEFDKDEMLVTSEFKFPDLGKGQRLLERVKQLDIPLASDIALSGGRILTRKNAVVDFNHTSPFESFLESAFVELNATNLKLEWGDESLSINRMIAFLDDFSGSHPREVNAYANLNLNDEIHAKGSHLRLRSFPSKTSFESGLNVWEINGSLAEIPFRVKNLAVPFFEFNSDGNWSEIFQKQQTFKFGSASIFSGPEEFKLDEAKINFRSNPQLKKWNLEIPKLNVHFPVSQLSLYDCSYRGGLDLNVFPPLPENQELKIERIQAGDDFQMSNIKISFALKSSDEIFIKNLQVKDENFDFEFNPARLSIKNFKSSTADSPMAVEFAGADLFISHAPYQIDILGLRGEVLIQSLDPFITLPLQNLTFEKVRFGDFEFTDGNLSFSIEDGVTCLINKLSVSGLEGEIGLVDSSYSLLPDKSLLNFFFNEVHGQEIADLFKDLNLKVDGKFSGELPLVPTENESWDFIGGFLRYSEQGGGHYSWNADGIFTSGLDESDPHYKEMYLAEEALKNLSLDSMRLDFKVAEGKREIRGKIIGESMVEGKKVSLDYNPKIVGSLSEILDLLDRLKVESH